MNSWDDVVAAALLGTARAGAPEPAPGLPPTLGHALDALPPTADAARRLLDLAALGALHRDAGTTPQPARPAAPVCQADDLTPASSAARARLAGLLARAGGRDPVVVELLVLWLRTAAGAGLAPAAAQVPALLDLAVRTVAIRDAVLAATGTRGRWLIEQGPQWRALMPIPTRTTEATTTEATGDPSGRPESHVPASIEAAPALSPDLDASTVHRLLTEAPSPWSQQLAEAVLAWLAHTGPAVHPQQLTRIFSMIGLRLPLPLAGQLRAVGARWPGGTGRHHFVDAVDLVTARRELVAELLAPR